MNTYLFSIHPKWCERIFNGKKTIEVRKTAPKPPFKVVVYCTKGNTKIYLGKDRIFHTNCAYDFETGELLENILMNGKVIGEFICNKVDKCEMEFDILDSHKDFYNTTAFADKSKVTYKELKDYLASCGRMGIKNFYGLHITATKLYDKPKELGEFKGYCNKKEKCYKDIVRHCNNTHLDWKCNSITRPPQSYMRIQCTEED